MPPKTGKRKAAGKKPITTKKAKANAITTPDRLTWPGWVEMESEPAFFNVMLKDMGVRGVKVNEVWSLDDNDMAMLPQPVHGLIFLFRYQATDKTKLETECPKQVWYAEQVPDFACATFALLNIVNNIPGLELGQELRAFKQRTQDMTPRHRGDAIDDFTFVKRIHNSFSRDEDLLNADSHLKEKLTRARKEQAVAKAKKTKAANAAARAAKSTALEEKVSKPAPTIKSSPPEENSSKAAPAVKDYAPRANYQNIPPAVKSGPFADTTSEGIRAPRSSPSDEERARFTAAKEAKKATKNSTPTNKSTPTEKSTSATKNTSATKSSPLVEKPKEASPKGTRTSKRNKKPTIKAAEASPSKFITSDSPVIELDTELPNIDVAPKKATKSPDGTPTKVKGGNTLDQQPASSSSSTSSKRKNSFNDRDEEVIGILEIDTKASSAPKSKANANANASKKLKLNGPKKNAAADPDAEFAAITTEQATAESRPRRSGREPKPRKDLLPAAEKEEDEAAAAEAQVFDEEGFHFCAYMPIGDRLWKLDGMDGFPQDMGPIEDGVDWLNIAQPALQERMAQYAAGAIEFNLMAVVHDPMVACTEALAANVKALEATEAKLKSVAEDWREMLDEYEDISALVNSQNNSLGLHNADIERVSLTTKDQQALVKAEDLTELLALRKEIIYQQHGLRRACEDEMYGARADASKARTRRQDHETYCDNKQPAGTLDLDTGVYKKGIH
jgi:hypothetical protein